jgi:hypothetical protein
MSTVTVSPLRQRKIEDMNARKLCAETQRGHIHSCRRFAAFLKQSPDTATAEINPVMQRLCNDYSCLGNGPSGQSTIECTLGCT